MQNRRPGNIRSVSVDYFGSSAEAPAANELKQQQQQQVQDRRLKQEAVQSKNQATSGLTRANWSHQSRNQSPQSTTTTTTTATTSNSRTATPISSSWHQSGVPEMEAELARETDPGNRWQSVSSRSSRGEAQRELSALELAIIESLVELSQVSARVQSTRAPSATRGAAKVQVAELIAQLEKKFVRLPAIEYVDCAIGNLVDCGQLRLEGHSSELARPRRQPDCRSLFANRMLSLNGQGASEQLGFDCWSPAASRSGTAKSKSTTLDSGIQSLDSAPSSSSTATSELLQERARETEGQVQLGRVAAKGATATIGSQRERRSFSLTRSLSLRPKRDRWLQSDQQSGSQQDRRAASLVRSACQQQDKTRQTRQQAEQTNNLSSLFRSKSMRVVSVATSRRQQEQQDRSYITNNDCDYGDQSHGSLFNGYRQTEVPTIDYLATAHHHKRGFSIRRNSLLTFGSRDDQSAPASGSGGKILLFLRRLFAIRRARSHLASGHQTGEPLDRPSGLQTSEGRHYLGSVEENEATQHITSTNKRNHLSASSPSSSSSSGSNSLIEILDCSPAVRDSRRRLRCEPNTLVTGANPNRATWRLLKRSDSTLSRNSAISCATTKSTASQQLRRHLDEASKRHRNCTSQRDREFIDSINVLRQASRHALQTSRSPSKSSRQTKSEPRSPTNDVCSPEMGTQAGIGIELSMSDSNKLNNQAKLYTDPQAPLELDLIRPTHGELVRQPSDCSHLWPPTEHADRLAPAPANCSICASYLSSAAGHLCPLGCCPAGVPPLTTACCLAKTAGQVAEHAALLPPPDLCCPLWRSMVYNYLPPASDLYARLPLSPMMSHHPNLVATEHRDGFSSAAHLHQQQQHHQQNQHNTTIDLKIEIGADFQKKLDELNGGSGRAAKRPSASRLDDSLDSDHTDESLASSSNGQSVAPNQKSDERDVVQVRLPVNQKDGEAKFDRQEAATQFEPDSCDSDGANSQSSDSLGAQLA